MAIRWTAAAGVLAGILVGCTGGPITIAPPRNLTAGGRAVAIAVDPTNAQRLIVASETGGLFQTYNGGQNWTHAGLFPSYLAIDVAMASLVPETVIATAASAYRVVNDGGIWRSTDGGSTWNQPVSWAPTSGPTCMSRPSAYGISNMPLSHTFYVGTDCGIAVSQDDGATWTTTTLPYSATPIPNPVYAVLVINPTHGVAYALHGLYYLNSTGAWKLSPNYPDTGQGCRPTPHALASPWFMGTPAVFFHAACDQTLWRSTDSGATWRQVLSNTSHNRTPFVRVAHSVVGDDTTYNVYFGDGSWLWRYTMSGVTNNALGKDSAGVFLVMDHADPADIAFDADRRYPILLATDGGVHITADQGSDWSLVGAGYGGYEALQIAEIDGQYAQGSSPHQDLYFDTQDNDIRASTDGGRTWPGDICCEGRNTRVGSNALLGESNVSGVACGRCFNFMADGQFAGYTLFPNAPNGKSSDPAGPPIELVDPVYDQYVIDSSDATYHFYQTGNRGSSWRAVFWFADKPVGVAAFADGLAAAMYLGVSKGSLDDSGEVLGIDRVTYHDIASTVAAADSDLFAVGALHTVNARYTVFGVDPNNGSHLLAPDVELGEMMASTTGGTSWFPLPPLTDIVTDTGRYFFTHPLESDLSLVSAIGWDPFDSCHILIGTHENGVFRSTDGANTWTQIPGSNAAPYITGFYFPPSGSVWMSTYGRGLWTLNLSRPAGGSGTRCGFTGGYNVAPSPPRTIFIDPSTGRTDSTVCPKCTIIAVRNGWITGLALAGDTVRQIGISSGTIARTTSAGKELPLDIPNTYQSGTLTLGGRLSASLLARRRVRALVVEGAILRRVIASPRELALGPKRDVRVMAFNATRVGAEGLSVGDRVRVVGAHFLPPGSGGQSVRVLFDRRVVATNVPVRANGSFSIDLPVRRSPGDMVVTVEQQDGQRLTRQGTTIDIASTDEETQSGRK